VTISGDRDTDTHSATATATVTATEGRRGGAHGAFLEHERLDVYRAALAFHELASKVVPQRGHSALRDQLDRASVGIVLCIAEGAGRRSAPDKRRFYEMARGSAESAAVLDVLHARRLLSDHARTEGRQLLLRIVQMLTRLSGLPRDP
jgi:four helix bundle protein